MREIVFDTETTGLDPMSGDRLVEIGCIELVNRVATGRTFHAYFNPDRADADRGRAGAWTQPTPSLPTKKRFHEHVFEELLEFIADSPLVAHNAQFDFGFLNYELGVCGLPIVSPRPDDRYAGARPAPPSGSQAFARRAVHALRRRPQPPRDARRAARRRAARASLCRADRRPPDRPRADRRGRAGRGRGHRVPSRASAAFRRASPPYARAPEELARHKAVSGSV